MTPPDPWWASGRSPDDGLDASQDPLDAHQHARRGDAGSSDGDEPRDPSAAAGGSTTSDAARLATEAIDLVSRLAAEAGRRVSARATANADGSAPGAFTRPDPDPDPDPPTAPHADGEVCDACPVCIGLRALRQVRPEVIAHLSDAAHHLSLALRAFAEAQAGGPDEGLERIDLDP